MKPSIPKGTRDFLPDAAVKRQYLFATIAAVFRKYGYTPIETPSMESMATLTGKYGEEGDRLLFRVLNNGDFLKNADPYALSNKDSQALAGSIAKRGMRYDLTVPFARFVVMHQNDLPFPFKRFQIQPVWRADRPQKGRYQEFYQCDVDVVGSPSLLYEAEMAQIYDEVFTVLGLNVVIRINNRKILTGIAEVCGIGELLTQMTTSIDKWDKIGEEGVRKEMGQRGIPASVVDSIISILSISETDKLSEAIQDSKTGLQGITEIKEVLRFLSRTPLQQKFVFDVRLARGLDYYTGCIFEVDVEDAEMGSLGGGGRYDDLTSVFGLNGVSGVGISFGAERIYDVMETLQLFPSTLMSAPQILFAALSEDALAFAFETAAVLRKQNITVDIYPDVAKLQKQLRYANQLKVPFVAIIGDDELLTKTVMFKTMVSGEQRHISVAEMQQILLENRQS